MLGYSKTYRLKNIENYIKNLRPVQKSDHDNETVKKLKQ